MSHLRLVQVWFLVGVLTTVPFYNSRYMFSSILCCKMLVIKPRPNFVCTCFSGCVASGNSQTFHLYHVETSYPFQRRVTLLLWLFDTIPMPLVACKLKSNSNRSSKLLAMELHLSHNPCYSTAGDTRKASTKQAFKSSFLQCICKNQHNHKD